MRIMSEDIYVEGDGESEQAMSFIDEKFESEIDILN